MILKKQFGCFQVTSFNVPHDSTENRGFLIECDGEKLLYATDFSYIPYSFKKKEIDHLMIECNYIKDLVDDEADNRNHIWRGHAELQTTLGVIETNKTSALRTVILVHLSNENADSEQILEQCKQVANCDTYIARKGLEVELSLPF